jgi:hypothetical protein
MTCLSCAKCHSHDFEQLTPFYDKDGLKQVFKCKNCGEEIHLDPKYSAITMPTVTVGVQAEILFHDYGDLFLTETIRRLWLEIDGIKKKLREEE